jgi:hypothetical protein
MVSHAGAAPFPAAKRLATFDVPQPHPARMHPRTEEVLEFFAVQNAALEQAIESVPTSSRSKRPSPDCWSVAEVVAHLAIVEGRVAKLLQSRIGAARESGLGAERLMSPIVPDFPLDRILDRSRLAVAGAASQPPADSEIERAIAMLGEGHEALRSAMAEADGLALSEVMAPNPVLGDLNVYQWVVFLGAHEARHALQIREIAASLDGTGSSLRG